jgi:hypothetical protein
MAWLLILVIVMIVVGVLWSLASRVGRGYNVRSQDGSNGGVEGPDIRKR